MSYIAWYAELFLLKVIFKITVGKSSLELEEKIVKCNYTIPENISPKIQELIKGMLNVIPDKRIKLIQILQSEIINGKLRRASACRTCTSWNSTAEKVLHVKAQILIH